MNRRTWAMTTLVLALSLACSANAAAPPGWLIAGSAPNDYEFSLDTTTAQSGKESALIAAKPSARNDGFGTLMQTIAADHYRGARWRLSGYLRTEAANRAQIWMRVDGPNGRTLSFDNMDSRPVTGTTGWTRYEIVLDVPSESVDIAFGFFLIRAGKVWADDFKLEQVDTSVPVTSARPALPAAPLNMDFENTGATEYAASQSAGPQNAVWVTRTLRFVFRESDYNCGWLYDDVKRTLLNFGARASDLDVEEYQCASGRSGVEATFAVLAPAGAAVKAGTGPPLPAHWQPVDIRIDRLPLDESFTGSRIRATLPLDRQRVLTEIIKERILPLFPVRNVEFNGDRSVHLELLKPLQE